MTVDVAQERVHGSYLETEIPLQGELLRTVFAGRGEQVQTLVATLRERQISDWVVAGCGDSLFAGMAAEYWFAELAGTRVRALNALAFSRYLYRSVDPRTVVFAISYSGNTARVVEAAVAAKSRGATVIAITADERSKLIELADDWLPNDALQERSNCRTLSFQAALALLHLTAASLAGVAPPDPAIAAAVETLAIASAGQVSAIVAALPEDSPITVIGGGFAYPIACYGAAKLYEAATMPAHVAELEQFIHCEIFPLKPGSCVALLAPAGASYARAVEVADGLAQLGCITVGISDEPAFADRVTHFVALPSGHGEAAIPYLASIPLQRLALGLALRKNENPDLVSNKAVNRPLIESPLAWTAADYEARG